MCLGRSRTDTCLKTLLLDRDGTLIVNEPYSADPHSVTLLPTVIDSLLLAQSAGWQLIIITNQSGIARGYLDIPAFWARQTVLLDRLKDYGIHIAATYYCPHHPDYNQTVCMCRKPEPGLIYQAMQDHHATPDQTYMIGDAITDCLAAHRAGIPSYFLGSANPDLPQTAHCVPSFGAAIQALV